MGDHTSDRVGSSDPSNPQAQSLKAPMAFDASTRHRRVYAHVREEPSASSPDHVTLDIGNQYSNSWGPKDKRCRRKLETRCDTSSFVHSVSARRWYVPVRLYGDKLRFLLDSGADVYGVHGASVHSLYMRDTCQLPLEIGNSTYPVDCTIMERGCLALLGMSFIEEFGKSLLCVHTATVHTPRRSLHITKL